MATIDQSASQKITPFLWFDGKVEEAANFYTSVFTNSEIINLTRMPGEAPGHAGTVTIATIRLSGVEFMLLDGGPMFKFTEAVSFYVHCKTQEEVDDLWGKLTADGGNESQCGWLKDKYGLSWQIIPDALGQLMGDPNRAKAKNVMNAMLQMRKIDVAGLKAAYDKG
ncbi:MAG TPA: VOC family protein [Mucilaginibacter sp.]|jgi:predicted 3-demethylubiquinone-9 3-methyltransferase (glyoxalase superfamily)